MAPKYPMLGPVEHTPVQREELRIQHHVTMKIRMYARQAGVRWPNLKLISPHPSSPCPESPTKQRRLI